MNIALRYSSRGGNTKKLADAVADALGVTASDVSVDLEEKADILFLGASVYAGTFDKPVGSFLNKNAANIGTIVCFGSSASGKTVLNKVRAWAEATGVNVYNECFNCYGHFLMLHRDRPNEDDCRAAGEFALAALKSIQE